MKEITNTKNKIKIKIYVLLIGFFILLFSATFFILIPSISSISSISADILSQKELLSVGTRQERNIREVLNEIEETKLEMKSLNQVVISENENIKFNYKSKPIR